MEPFKPESRKRLLKVMTEEELAEYEQLLSDYISDPAVLDPGIAKEPSARMKELSEKARTALS